MNIYLRELKRNRKSLIIWSIIMIGLIVLMMSVYPSVARDSQNMEQMIESMPQAFSTIFGLDKLSLSDIFGYYSMEGYLFVTLMGSIYAIMLSAGILSKEESDKTVEFLLSKPITRREVVTSKLLVYLTNIIIFNVVMTITLFISFQMTKTEDFSMKLFWLISVAPLLLHLTFGAIGFLISVFITKGKKILPVSLGIVLITFFFSIIANISDKLEGIKYLTPFKYVEASDIILNERIDLKYIMIMVLINVICVGMTYVFYNKKDISV
ncbi:ABC transporter permease subunit [Dethiothermospora halolimnae]|uniref:ABC transporter permease subunit n=1 Tax=Dethiothermospora halolimnae TaxID=3114390 RepID=UPI003CCC2A59